MPHGWTAVRTPKELQDRLNNPEAFARKVSELVEKCGAVTEHILWEKPGGPAYILTCVPAANADEVFTALNRSIGRTRRIYDGEEIRRIARHKS